MLKAKLVFAACAVGAMAVACGGERDRTGTVGNEGTGTSGAAGTSGANPPTMTLTGCVQAGEPAGTYVLRPTGGEGGTAGTAGTGATGSGGTEGREAGRTSLSDRPYRLIPSGSDIDFADHVGKEVRVTGEVAQSASGIAEPGAGTQGSYGTSGQGSASGQSGQGSGAGSGSVGTNVERESSRGSGGGRLQGRDSDQPVASQFFRVTRVTQVADTCRAGGR